VTTLVPMVMFMVELGLFSCYGKQIKICVCKLLPPNGSSLKMKAMLGLLLACD
jgi:hypothetical protein